MVDIAPSIAGGMISGTSPFLAKTTTSRVTSMRVTHALIWLILMLIPSGSPISSVQNDTPATRRIALSINKLSSLLAPVLYSGGSLSISEQVSQCMTIRVNEY